LRSRSGVERRLVALVGHLLTDLGYRGAHLEHDALDAAPDRKIATRRAPRRQARQCVNTVPAIPSISASTSARRTKVRCFSSILMRSNAAFAKACSASAAARGDCCRSRRKYRRSETGSF
jgi:hypothetical protein